MAELIHEHVAQVKDLHGTTYRIIIFGETSGGNLWEGWIEFRPIDSAAPVLRTGRETIQHDRAALTYWATGLEPVYLEGALQRARPSTKKMTAD